MLNKFMLSRERKNKILDSMELYCNESKVSNKTLGYTLRSYHVSCPFVFLIVLFYSSKLVVTIVLIFLICIFICFTLSNGCLLTMLEHRLCGDEYTIADPFIQMTGIEESSKNKIFVSNIIAINYFIFYIIVYYIRFYA